MFLLVPAHPYSPRKRAIKQLCVIIITDVGVLCNTVLDEYFSQYTNSDNC